DKKWARILISPGLLLQKLTTREPDDSQLEVALTALRAVLEEKENIAGNNSSEDGYTSAQASTV
ncbi:MAG: DUF1385 domain-containing protein, partial [Syntrophomonas sp.]